MFAEDEQRPVVPCFVAQSTEKPGPEAVAGHRRRREDPRRGVVFTGESRPRPGGI